MATYYDENENRLRRRAQLENVQQPAAYTPQYDNEIRQAVKDYANRKPFTYDVNADALYQQYKDQYTKGGRLAMQDTMAQAAAMTGGYGNSYAASAGNQAYQAYMGRLNEAVPQLYQMALSRYQMEDEAARNRYNLYANEDARQYGRYTDDYNRWMQAYQQREAESQYDRSLAENQRQFNETLNLNTNKYITGADPDYTPWKKDEGYEYAPAETDDPGPGLETKGDVKSIAETAKGVARKIGQAGSDLTLKVKYGKKIENVAPTDRAKAIDAMLDNGEITKDEAARLIQIYGIY